MEFRKFAAEAATRFTRAVQYTEEKFGASEKTELDAHFENLAQRADRTKQWTEKILARTEGVLTPNPNNRIEDFFFEKLDKKPRDRLSNLEMFGVDLLEAGNDFGSGTPYGTALIKVGHAQQRLGQAEREFVQSAVTAYIQPLRKFLDGDMKTLGKERRILENRRLDLDACKNRLRKARSMDGQQNAERDLRVAQTEFDRQAEITKLLLEGISSTHAHHLRCLNDFVESQVTFHAQCHQIMQDLQREMSNASMTAAANASDHPSLFTPNSQNTEIPTFVVSGLGKKARVMYKYDAEDSKELSLQADEVLTVYNVPGLSPDWMIGERGAEKGKVPVAYLEILN